MLTDRVPRKASLLSAFVASDELRHFPVPSGDHLRTAAKSIEAAMQGDAGTLVQQACDEFLNIASEFYGVPKPGIRVLAARPLRVREGGGASELFGDYALETHLIRVWMRTAILKEVTSFGTFLSTLCHEFCHHLDFQRFGWPNSYHTRGFYERTAALYHHARGTPTKRLFWAKMRDGRWRIDWPRTNRGV